MFNKVEKEYKRFINKQFKKLFGNFEPEIGNNVWADIWKEYYIENKSTIDEKLNLLKDGFDDKSKNIVDMIFERYVFLMPFQKFNKDFLYNKDSFFSKEELDAQKEDIQIDKGKYKLPAGIYYETSIFKYAHGLTCLPEAVLNSIKTKDFIDAGAFAGDSAIVLNDYTQGKIYSFEPCEGNFNFLQETIKLNNLENKLIPIRSGVGEKTGTLDVYPTEFRNSAISVSEENKKYAQTINIVSIDDFVNQKNVNLGVIKLDVEGYELEAIQGAVESIKKFKPVLLISVYHHPKDFLEIKPLIKSFIPEYKFVVRKLNDFSPTYETMLIGWCEG